MQANRSRHLISLAVSSVVSKIGMFTAKQSLSDCSAAACGPFIAIKSPRTMSARVSTLLSLAKGRDDVIWPEKMRPPTLSARRCGVKVRADAGSFISLANDEATLERQFSLACSLTPSFMR